MPRVVFQKLTGELHRIPRNAVDSGDARIVDARQKMMQPVTEFVEQREDVVVSQECRSVLARRQEIAHKIGNRLGESGGQPLAAHALVHPCAASLVRARVRIEIEVAHRLTVTALDLEEPHVRVPDGHALTFANSHTEEALRHFEQARQDAGQRKIRTQLFLGDRIAAALQALRVEAHVPGREPRPGKLLQLREFLLRGTARRLRELVQEPDNLIDGVGHPGRQRVVGVTAKIQQARGFVPFAQDVLHDRRIVPAAGIRSLLGRAGRPRFVKGLAQHLGFGIGHHRDVGGLVQGEDPALKPRFVSALARLLHEHLVESPQVGRVADVVSPPVRRVQHVFLELRL